MRKSAILYGISFITIVLVAIGIMTVQHNSDRQRVKRLSLIATMAIEVEIDIVEGDSEVQAYEKERQSVLKKTGMTEDDRPILDRISFEDVKLYRANHPRQMETARKNGVRFRQERK